MKLAQGSNNSSTWMVWQILTDREAHVKSIEAQVTDLQENITHLQQERTELFTKVWTC